MPKSKKDKKVGSQTIVFDPTAINKAKAWEDFVSLWTVSQEIDARNQWFKGDIALRVAILYGKGSLRKFAADVEETASAIEHYRRVSRAFPVGKRHYKLSWTHYLIASFTDSYLKGQNKFSGINRVKWIEQAHDNSWSTTRLQAEIKKKKAFADNDSVFLYYEEYLKKVRNVLMHIEKKKMKEEEKNKLIHKLLDVYNEFMVYLKS